MKRVTKKLVLFLALAVACVLGMKADAYAADKIANLNTLYYVDGSSGMDGDNYYMVTLPKSGRLTVQYSVSESDYGWGEDLIIYDAAGNELYVQNASRGRTSSGYVDLVSGQYKLVYSDSKYFKGSFKLIFQSAGETLKDSLEDKHDTLMTAAYINSTNKTVKAQFAKNNNTDYFKLIVKKDGIYKITINSKEIKYTDFQMTDEFGEFNYQQSDIPAGKRVFKIPVKKGIYYLMFYNNNSSTGKYSFTTKLVGGTKTYISKVKNSSKRAAKVTWKRKSDVSGYQVQIALNKGFTKGKKNSMVTTNAQSSKTFKYLKKGKTYYVRVRTYTLTPNNKKVYSAWSAVKAVKIKK